MTDTITTIGPHLLGRLRPDVLDARDVRMETVFAFDAASPPHYTLDATMQQAVDNGWVRHWPDAYRFVHWLRAQPHTPPLPPAPPGPMPPGPAPLTSVVWGDPQQLDQGQTGRCVAYAWTHLLDSDDFTHTQDGLFGGFAIALYGAIKRREGDPTGDPAGQAGAYVGTGAKELQARGRIKTYVAARTTAEITQWILTMGPVIVGTSWHDGMFHPDASGLIIPTGPVVGGHAYIIDGVDTAADMYYGQNSWGDGWGVKGHFRIAISDFAALLADNGDAYSTTEIPLATLRTYQGGPFAVTR